MLLNLLRVNPSTLAFPAIDRRLILCRPDNVPKKSAMTASIYITHVSIYYIIECNLERRYFLFLFLLFLLLLLLLFLRFGLERDTLSV